MEQSSNDITITDKDMEVAKIMFELPQLLVQSKSQSKSQSRDGFAFTSWLTKKERTSRENVAAAAAALPPPPPPSLPSNAETVGTEENRSSPATPLAFPASESDEKVQTEPSKRKSYNLEKRKEQLLKSMEEFTRRNVLLKKYIETKKRFHDQLMAENVELKAKKQRLLGSSKSLNLKIKLPQIPKEMQNSTASYHHQQPLMTDDQTVHKVATNKNCEYPIGGTSKLQDDNVGPVGRFDLNVSAEDQDTVTKARAAEARFNRKKKCRSKKFNATHKSR